MAKVTADKLARFRPQTRNANRHTQRGMGQLEASMRKYGYVTPMTAAADGEIIDGSARAETGATVFGDDVLVVHHDGTKPVIMVRDDIPSADTPEAREISIAANRIAQVNLDFDPEVLLGDLQAGVDLSAFWRQDELDELLADLTPKTTGDTEPQTDRAEELREKWGVRPGDLWQLGEHKLICGDCTDAATVARVMGGESAALGVTSPPYGVGKDYETGGLDEWKRTVSGMLFCAAAVTDAMAINLGDVKVGPNSREVHSYGLLIELCAAAGLPLIGTRIWVKGAAWAGQGPYWLTGYRSVDEFEYIGLFGSIPHVDRTTADWRYRGVWDIASVTANKLHSAMFPLELPERLITLLCDSGAIVYEPFSGSGTTIIACENLSRRCRAVEISAAYCAVALQRWADHTQRAPVLLEA